MCFACNHGTLKQNEPHTTPILSCLFILLSHVEVNPLPHATSKVCHFYYTCRSPCQICMCSPYVKASYFSYAPSVSLPPLLQGNDSWNELVAPDSQLYPWDPRSTYIKSPPFFEDMVSCVSIIPQCCRFNPHYSLFCEIANLLVN